ncbi:MAG: protein O-mannosyl-transferase family, partial [Anaerolineae bacterium]
MHQKLSATWAGLRRWGSAHAAFLRTAGVWIGAFVIYAATTARGVLPADSGEFQLVAWGWGIAHPPGYPLYTIATAVWTHLVPLGPALLRINLFSAALAATTVALCGRTVVLWARSTGASQAKAEIGGLVSALALGLAATFWAQATTANIRMPTMLFTACGYLALARYRAAQDQTSRQSRRQGRALIGLGLVVGLGIGHHPSLAFVAIGWALYLVLLTPRLVVQPRRWLPVLVVAAAGWALPQLYLPLRSSMENVPLNPSDLTTWSGFWDHVLARGFGGDMFAFATAQDLAQRLPLLPTLFRMQFPPLILLAMVLGWLWLFIKDHHIGLSLLASWLIQTFVTITYRAPQTVEYLMPAYIPMVLALGLALARLPDGKERRGRAARLWQPVSRAIPLLSLLILGLQAPGHIRDFALLAKDRSVRERIEPLLHTAPEDALILADWRWATPLWVLQTVEGLAPEVEVAYVYPEEGRAYEEVWRARAEQASPR